MMRHESEDFQEWLGGRGDYTEEELEDPSAVIAHRWEEASEVRQTLLAGATQVLSDPANVEVDSPRQVSWWLADRTISVGLCQADQACPVEVCL